MPDGARLLHGRDDRHLAERAQGTRECCKAIGAIPVVVRHENEGHGSNNYTRTKRGAAPARPQRRRNAVLPAAFVSLDGRTAPDGTMNWRYRGEPGDSSRARNARGRAL